MHLLSIDIGICNMACCSIIIDDETKKWSIKHWEILDLTKNIANDENNKNMDSKIILKKALSEAENKNYQIGNIDLTIITEEPKLSPHIKNIKNTLSQTLNLETNRIGLKVTTNEKIGAIGRMEGIAAFAVCTLILKNIN